MALTYDNVIKWWGDNIVSTQAGAHSTVPVTFNLTDGAAGQKLTLIGPTAILPNDTAVLSAQSNQGGAVTLDVWTPDTCSLNGTTLTAIKLGVCGVRASSPGFTDGNGNSYADAAQQYLLIPIVVASATTTTTLAANSPKLIDGQSTVLTATVSGTGTPSGTVTFTRAASSDLPALVLCTDVPVANGTATCNVSADSLPVMFVRDILGYLSLGAHHLVADFHGSAAFQNSGGDAFLPVYLRANLRITSPSENPYTTRVGVPVTITVELVPAKDSYPDKPTGDIAISDGPQNCSFTWLSGIFIPATSCGYTPTTEGTYSVVAHYKGDKWYAPVDSDPLGEIVIGPKVNGAKQAQIHAAGQRAGRVGAG